MPTTARAVALVTAAVVLGFGVGLALTALPLFAIARFLEPGSGLDRPLVRTGLVRFVLPLSALVAVAAGVLTGRWLSRRPE